MRIIIADVDWNEDFDTMIIDANFGEKLQNENNGTLLNFIVVSNVIESWPVALCPPNSPKWNLAVAHLELAETCEDGKSWTTLDLQKNMTLLNFTDKTAGYTFLKMEYSQSEYQHQVYNKYVYFQHIWNNDGVSLDLEKPHRINFKRLNLLIQTELQTFIKKKMMSEEQVQTGTRYGRHGNKFPVYDKKLKGK